MITANGFAQGVIDVHSHLEEKPSAAIATANMIVRIAEIEVYPQYLQEYLAFANEVDRLSIEREPGVICLYPMQSVEDSCQIRILEIYASEQAGHTPHGERPQTAHHEATRPRDNETDIQKTKINDATDYIIFSNNAFLLLLYGQRSESRNTYYE